MKARNFLIVLALIGGLLLFGERVFSGTVFKGNGLSDYQQPQQNDTDDFSPTMDAGNCIERTPPEPIHHDLHPLLIAWAASILLTFKIARRWARSH